jgi:hypothetical protein
VETTLGFQQASNLARYQVYIEFIFLEELKMRCNTL